MKIVIIGAGEVGFHIAHHLARENKQVVIIDQDPEAIRRVSDNLDAQTLIGLGSSPEILEQAAARADSRKVSGLVKSRLTNREEPAE